MTLLSTLTFATLATLYSVVLAGNATIDDTFGDSKTGAKPSYRPPSGAWNDNTCQTCRIVPDKKQTQNGTWHEGTYNPSMPVMAIDMKFKGTGIDVFFILANTPDIDGTTTETQVTFQLDGKNDTDFNHKPDSTKNLLYNQKVYSKRNLQNTDHTLSIVTSGVDRAVWTGFDYAQYFFPDPTGTSKGGGKPNNSQTPKGPDSSQSDSDRPIPPGAIAGIAVGAAAGLLFLGCLGLWLYRRKQQSTSPHPQQNEVLPFAPNLSPGVPPSPPSMTQQQQQERPYHYQRQSTVRDLSPAAAIAGAAAYHHNHSETHLTSYGNERPHTSSSSSHHHGGPGLGSRPSIDEGRVPQRTRTNSAAADFARASLYADPSRSSERYNDPYRDSHSQAPPPVPAPPNPYLVSPTPPPPVPQGTRQGQLETQARELRVKMQGMINELHNGGGDDRELRGEIKVMKERIRDLEDAKGSSWAYGETDVVPDVLRRR